MISHDAVYASDVRIIQRKNLNKVNVMVRRASVRAEPDPEVRQKSERGLVSDGAGEIRRDADGAPRAKGYYSKATKV